MDFTVTFLQIFMVSAFYVGPILLFLVLIIALTGLLIGRREGWSRSDALYYAFITATTVGYGDFRPSLAKTKFAAIIIALLGIVLTGIIVAVALKSLEVALIAHYDIDSIIKSVKSVL